MHERTTKIIIRASEAHLDPKNLMIYLAEVKKLFGHSKFDDAGKIGHFLIHIEEVDLLRLIAIVLAVTDYKPLHQSIKDYDSIT